MHPVLSSPRALLSYLLAWLALGVVLAWALVAAQVAPWPNTLLFALPVCLLYAFILPSAWYVCRALPLNHRRLGTSVALFGGTSVVAGATWLGLCLAWAKLAQGSGADWATLDLSWRLAASLLGLGSGAYLLSLLGHDLLLALDTVRRSQAQEARSRELAREAELLALRNQINPHFLFNCLNSISALTSANPAAARDMTIALAQYFRQTLALAPRSHVTLAQELAQCQCLLEIERLRFGDALQVTLDVSAAAQSARLAPMLLQPLVENAVKHGVARRQGGGLVHLSAQVRGPWLHLRVQNPLGTHKLAAVGTGTGLANVRQRLANLHGDQARLSAGPAGEYFVVEMTLPWTQNDPSPDR